MFNKVVIVGNLTRDIELRYTPSGAAIGKSAIAATHKFTINGEKKEDTCFIDISFFGNLPYRGVLKAILGNKLLRHI